MRENNKIKKFLKEILKDLDELKAADIVTIDIKDRSALADYLIIASGNSSRHINSIASKIIKKNKKQIISIEGLKSTEWVIVDFGDIILNLFRPETREYYSLEKIWESGVEDEKISFA
ncbi:MAG: ribosome silencing factor [Pseudomonadota bacterium]|nr:ribosome silencing factor [Pseudomonadota bacterium]